MSLVDHVTSELTVVCIVFLDSEKPFGTAWHLAFVQFFQNKILYH